MKAVSRKITIGPGRIEQQSGEDAIRAAEIVRIEKETFARDMKEYVRYLISIIKIETHRRRNPKWREIK
jgi:hypothetical protein